MQLDIKFKSIGMRWFINIFLILVIVVLIFTISFALLFNSLYTERVSDLASDYAYEFFALSGANENTFNDAAIEIAGQFVYKDKVEVQVFDKNGKAIVSTSGFLTDGSAMPDYETAIASKIDSVAKSTTADGEPVIAGTVLLHDTNGNYLGAYRWITSMTATRKSLAIFIFSEAVIAILFLAFSAITGAYFIKSIVRPIRDVSNIARKIAMGEFDSRIEIKKNDEIGELCDSINYMASELSVAQNLKNDFISSVSHELRTPLTAIKGWGETAKMSVGVDEVLVERGLEVVLSEADRLSNLVEELLDFSRMESGRMTVVSSPLNISLLLKESADMYIELARQQGIDLVFTTPSEQLEVMGDTDRLKQVFINIIDNAVKYTESGGQVLIDQLREEGCVRITVKDTGVGIPAQDIDRIKEKFYKANKTVRGSGIGLAVADEIIKQHQGLLFIESIEGTGTTATIVLPLYEPEEDFALQDEPCVPLIPQPEQDSTEDIPKGEENV